MAWDWRFQVKSMAKHGKWCKQLVSNKDAKGKERVAKPKEKWTWKQTTVVELSSFLYPIMPHHIEPGENNDTQTSFSNKCPNKKNKTRPLLGFGWCGTKKLANTTLQITDV